MSRQTVLAIIGAVSIVNGLFNPVLIVLVQPFLRIWYPWFLDMDVATLHFLTAILGSTITFLASGVPAALVERANGWNESSALSMYVWLGTAVLFSLPATPVLLSL